MKLYLAPGACSLAPHILLRELGLPFDSEVVDLRTGRTASGADFKEINPKGYVPALQLDDGEVLTEGVAIMQYLVDSRAPGGLAPTAGTVERARLTAHLNFIAAEFHKAFGPLFNPSLSPEAREAAMANIRRKLDVMERALSDDRPYLLGDAYTIADAYLFVIAGWAPMFGQELSSWPKVQALVARVAERPAVQAALGSEAQMRAAA
jgi:glutathione S-transferase